MSIEPRGAKKRRALSIALLLSIIGNVVLLYRVVDLGVTVTHTADEISYKSKQLTDIEKLWPALAPKLSRADLLTAAHKTGLEVMEKKDEDSLFLGEVQFLLAGDQVTAMKLK